VRCPRCHAGSDDGARRCGHCGAPLLLDDDPPPAPLDRALDLDRRRGRRDLTWACEVSEERIEPVAADPGRAPVPLGECSDPLAGAVPAWRRAAAWGIDGSVLAVACVPPILLAWHALPAAPDLPATLLRTAIAFAALLGFAYAALGHALMGATVGKRLLGLQVVGPDGALPSLGRSAARSGLAVVGAAVLGLGPLMALFTRSRRSLHDLLADTVVIRTP